MKLLLIIVAVVLVVNGIGLFSGMKTPDNLGLTAEGKLRPCPSSPNAVCSEDPDVDRQVLPFLYRGTPEETRKAFHAFLQSRPRVTIRTETDDYLHATTRTAIVGFVDDVEFRFDDQAGVIQARSASRLGYSDLGANRKRLEAWREAWER